MSTKKPSKKASEAPLKTEQNVWHSFLDRVKSLYHHLKPFGWDLLGTFLILLAILSLLGLLNLSRGTLLNTWIQLIRNAFGVGAYLLVFLLAALGVLIFRHGAGHQIPLTLGRVLAIEGWLLVTLPLFAFMGGVSLERAYEGLDGGTLGWGLVQVLVPILTKPFTLLFYLFLFFIFAGISTGMLFKLVDRAREWSRVNLRTHKPVENRPLNRQRGTQENTSAQRSAKAVKSGRRERPVQREKPALVSWRDQNLPPMGLLLEDKVIEPDQVLIKDNARIIEEKLREFGVPVKVLGYRVGPTVTQYAVEPGYIERMGANGEITQQKVKVSKISSLSRDLALALSAQRLRIETPVPGSPYVGIEIPNSDNSVVRLRPILESEAFRTQKTPLQVALGRDVSGESVITDLEKLPHLLIAGTTNSGKSVCVTALATCLIMNNTPETLRLVMLDPKMVELVRFNGLPHMLGKVETQVDMMLAALQWAQMEMDHRYRLMAEVNARNLNTFNKKMEQKGRPTLPRIVIFIDELADLMLSAPEQTEHSLIRLAQMARATGIHMVVATQRPSTNVVTGLIKANFPARIAFAVATSVDSRVILDANGAETLLGKGDMLFLNPANPGLKRMQGVMVSDNEIESINDYWQNMVSLAQEPSPWENLLENSDDRNADQLLERAISVVKGSGKASVSLLQRRLNVGFPRAARIIDELEEMGVVGPAVGSGKEREVLLDDDESENDD